MRVAYIGLSSPIFYDYSTQVEKSKAELSSSPNPILESPFGLLLLFDELWFFTRSLCPINMRGLDYVRFVDEENMIADYENIIYSDRFDPNEDDFKLLQSNLFDSFKKFTPLQNIIGISWDGGLDHHTHELKIQNRLFSGSSFKLENLLFDIQISTQLQSRFNGYCIELITNSFNQDLFYVKENPYIETRFSEKLFINEIPSYQSRLGPYHQCIEEVRLDQNLQNFRKWVLDLNLPDHETDLPKIISTVQDIIYDAQREVFLKQFDIKSKYFTEGKIFIGMVTDLFFPYSSTIGSLLEENIRYVKLEDKRWQAFIVKNSKLFENI